MEDSEKMLDVAEPTEEVAEETTVVDEKTQEISEEFVESEETEVEETTEEKPKQTAEENANYAQIRRKAEEDANKKLEEAKAKAYEEGRLAAYKDKTNPYTGKPIVDLADVEMYETMARLEIEGRDPINDLPDAMIDRQRKEAKAIQEKKELEEKTKQEIDDFSAKYPTVDLGDLLNDAFFKDYIQGKSKTLTELYEGYTNFKNAFRASAIDVAKQTIANSKASPGSLGSNSETKIDYNSMSYEEFEKYIQMGKNGEL